jgi:hypothetical protein
MQRPKRACTERAQQKIQQILEWEACSESSQMFKETARQLDAQLSVEKKQKDYAPSSTSESENESEGADSAAETDKEADDSHDDADKKAEAFQSQAPETQEEPCSPSQN